MIVVTTIKHHDTDNFYRVDSYLTDMFGYNATNILTLNDDTDTDHVIHILHRIGNYSALTTANHTIDGIVVTTNTIVYTRNSLC